MEEIPKIWRDKATHELFDVSPFLKMIWDQCPKHEAKFNWKFWQNLKICKHCGFIMTERSRSSSCTN